VSELGRHLFVGGCSLAVAAMGLLTVASASPVHGVSAVRSESGVSAAPPTRPLPPTEPAVKLEPPVPVKGRPIDRRVPIRRAAQPDPYRSFGFDISWPQCRGTTALLPPALGPVAIVGVTGGRPFSTNPCLRAQWAWARSRGSASGYLNLAAPKGNDPFAFGVATARDALARARKDGIDVPSMWLDVEIGNHWTADVRANTRVVAGAITELRTQGVQAGVYSTPLDWHQITNGAALSVPVWMAVPDGRKIAGGCASPGFGGRKPDLVQAVFLAPDGHEVDGDLRCTTRPDFLRMLR
jgi:hypothetical protein